MQMVAWWYLMGGYKTEALEPCPFCGVPFELDNRPWSDGHDGWEFTHVDMPEAIRAKCPLVMECYDKEEEAIAALNTRAESSKELSCDGCQDQYYGDNCEMCVRYHRLTDCFKAVS